MMCFLICVLQLDMTDTGARIRVALHVSAAFRLRALSAIINAIVWMVLPKPISSASMPPEARVGLVIEKCVARFVKALGTLE